MANTIAKKSAVWTKSPRFDRPAALCCQSVFFCFFVFFVFFVFFGSEGEKGNSLLDFSAAGIGVTMGNFFSEKFSDFRFPIFSGTGFRVSFRTLNEALYYKNVLNSIHILIYLCKYIALKYLFMWIYIQSWPSLNVSGLV